MHAEVIIAGFGGQGILFGAKLLAQAALMEKKAVVMYPSYGAEVRGGTAHASIIIDDEPIGSPLVSSPDTLIILNKPSLIRFASILRKNGLLLVNTSMIQENIKEFKRNQRQKIIGIPATEIAEHAGSAKAANMVMLGQYLRRQPVIALAQVKKALVGMLQGKSPELLAANERALDVGFNYEGGAN